MDPDQDICVLCGKNGGQMNVIGDKGLNAIIRASIEKQENDIHVELIRLQQLQCPVIFITAVVEGLLICEKGRILFPAIKN